MRRPHEELSAAVTRALDLYLDAAGHEKPGWYVDMGGDHDPEEYKGWAGGMLPLDERLWAKVRDELNSRHSCILRLEEHENQVGGFHFEYHGRPREDLDLPDFVSAVSFWLPTEYLEQQGPDRVKALAVALARELPLTSGYASLAFNSLLESKPVMQFIREHCFLHPGMDVHHIGTTSTNLGDRVRGAYWLNFYGQPLVDRIGGEVGLRKWLTLPEVSTEELGAQKVLVSLGKWPESGDVDQKREMKPYRALARVLEPYLYEEPGTQDAVRRWQRRFLD
ncbi:DUF3396 domain-containing protein [Archangium violaceum]|nr:DUF3396 domain-containing protein [Archangium violaceum]